MNKFFRVPFATGGDRTVVPDSAPVDNSVSYIEGYGADYQRVKTDPLSKNIERDKMNDLFFQITNELSQLQSRGIPDFITTALNGGVAYSYAVNSLVRWTDNNIYISLVGANTSDPTNTTNWKRVDDIINGVRLANSAAVGDGDAMVATKNTLSGGVARTQHDRNADVIHAMDLGITGDGVTDDRAAILAAFDTCAAAGRVLVFPRRTYACSDWIPVPSNLKVWFEPGATLKLTALATTGDFFTGGRNSNGIGLRNCDNVDVVNLTLDVNSFAGTNGFALINANGVRVHNLRVVNTVHSTTTLGGRAIQVEGGIATGVYIWGLNIENCSIGVNFHADAAAGTKRVVDFNVYDVTMRNVDVPFNVDSGFANPQNGTVENMSGTVNGATLWNCGKLTWPGNSGATGGGIICGDRGSGLRVNDLRVVNETSYGGIGALVRGRVYGIELNNVRVDVPSMTAVVDFNEVGFGTPGAAAVNTTAFSSNVSIKSNLDYIVKGSTGGVGAARLQCSVAGATASLTGLVDTNGASTTALCTFENSDDGVSTGLMSLKDMSDAGNAFANFGLQRTGFAKVQHVKSAADEVSTGLFKLAAPNHSRVSIAYQVCVMYPQSTNDAAVTTQSGVASAVLDGSGNFARTVTATGTATVLDTVASLTVAVDLTFSAGEIFFAVTQNNETADVACDVYVAAQVIYSLGGTKSQPKITLL